MNLRCCKSAMNNNRYTDLKMFISIGRQIGNKKTYLVNS